MRKHRANDYWKGLDKKPVPSMISKVHYDGVVSIGAGIIPFASQLTLLCGPNGVGKTTLLRTIWALLSPREARESPTTVARLKSGQAILEFTDAEKASRAADFKELITQEEQPLEFEITHIDTSLLVSALQDHFCRFPNLSDALNGVAVLECTDDQLKDLTFLTQIPYSRARVYSVEADDTTRPFFEVEINGVSYDTRTMGLGELAAFYLWWCLESLQEKGIVLLEEPESYLSPRCQASLADILAKYSVRKHACIVVTTHSAKLILGAHERQISFLYRDGGNLKLGTGPVEALLADVGIETVADTLVLVEDRNAAHFARLWINHFDPATASRVEMVALNGQGDISKVLETLFERRPRLLRVIGLYDADQAENVPDKAKDASTVLPGNQPIEALYREMTEKEAGRIEPLLGIKDLGKILYAIRTVEIHDWFEEFCKTTKLSHEQLHMLLFKAWIAKPENEEKASSAFSALLSLLGEPSTSTAAS